MAKEKKKKDKPNIVAVTADLDDDERRRFHRLLRRMKYTQKGKEERAELLTRIHDLVKSNSERRGYEDKFAHNVTVTSKHERRRRFKRRWRFYTFLITGGLMLLLAGYLLYSYVLVTNEIIVEGTDRYASSELIDASGIMVGEKLFSPSIDEAAIEEKLTDRFPYIKSVKVRRQLPNKIVLELTEEEPVFAADIFGQYVLLSQKMRVLEITDTEPSGKYIKLKLPDVRRATNGQIIELDGTMLDVVRRAADAVCSETMRDGTSVLDVSDRFNIRISYGGRFRLELGSVNDIDIKLTIAFEIMKDDKFAGGNKGTIYLSDVNRPSAIIDNEVDLG